MRRSKSLGEFVPEIERFFRERRRNTRNNRNDKTEERTLKEYTTPSTDEPHVIFVYSTGEANNFEIKPALLNLVQQNQLSGLPTEDLNLHIAIFLRLGVFLKANQEAIRMHLFPFSLRDRASAWFHSLQNGSISSWDQMRQAFFALFFPLVKLFN